MADKAENKNKKKPEKKPNIIQKIGKFFQDCKSERKKIVWPTVKTTFKNLGVVLSSIISIAVFVGLLDYGLTMLLGTIMNIAT
ncbi:MAG: Protein translocase subunit SecE [Eubacteriales bacterium SKADARSKE-1]|nr:Protein translocase subunit SecE [Eubacteriales bacterium SKADARSKE-1]